MMSRGTLTIRYWRGLILMAAPLFLFALIACGGGGGGNSGSQKVTVTGVVDDGNNNVVANASCSFVDSDGATLATGDCDQSGRFQLRVSPDETGTIYCGPKRMTSLNLSTVVSTVGDAAGDTHSDENITPTTTVVTDIIRYENPPDLLTRKSQLILQAQSDPNLQLVVAMAGRLFRAMLANNVNTRFGGDHSGSNGGGGDGGRGDSGGVGGDAGDGADFSPLVDARCAFVIEDDLGNAEALHPAALADFLADGKLDRPDLAALADEVSDGVTASADEIRQAFEATFPDGLGEALTDVTDENGEYFLPIPANLAGYVRCTPKDQDKLVLATYISGRAAGDVQDDQDVNPATTVFSTLVATQLQGDLTTTKQNFLDDIAGLSVLLSGDNLPQGPLDGITLGSPPANDEVGLVAFSATALFDAFLKSNLDVDFPAAIDDLAANLAVEPTFLEGQGVGTAQAQVTAALVNSAISTAEGQLGTTLAAALGTARIEVTVIDAADGSAIPNAVVDIENGPTGITTDSEGRATITLSGMPLAATDVTLTVSAEADYTPVSSTTQVVAFATVDLTFRLSAPGGDEGTLSGSVVDVLDDTPLAGVTVSVWDDDQEIATAITDDQGSYSISSAPGSAYTLIFDIDGYLPTQYEGVTVTAGSTTFLETTLQVSEAYSGNGSITGTIRSALNNEVIAGVDLQLREGINNISGSASAETTTDTNGGYTFEAIPAGVYTVSASHNDYLEMHFTVFSAGEQTGEAQDASMSPVLGSGEIRIVLTWGATPSDLDSHLTGPSSLGGLFHCYYGDQEPDPGYVNLDIDDISSYGPETTTILQRLPGTYEFSVYDFTNLSSTTSSALSNSGAQVKVYGDTGLITTYNVPSGQGGTVWTVFTLDGASGEITPQNTMSYLTAAASARQFWNGKKMPMKQE
jgi:hypothetical protein